MLGGGLHFNRSRGDDRFYNPAKSRRNYHQNQKNPNLQRTQSAVVSGRGKCKETESENRTEETSKLVTSPGFESVELPLSNAERFLQAIIPSVNAQYLSKTTMRGWRTCDVEFQPYFVLSDLWESFKEWSAYGVGVPLVLNGSDSVVQYYVPSLSAIQIYVPPSKSPANSRHTSEDSDGDYFSRDSSSDGSSDGSGDSERDISRKMERLFLRAQHSPLQEGFSSDDSESGNHRGCLLFEYVEYDPPFCREPLADKISDLASRFPALKLLRSCDLLSSSWLSVAWYPIYRIPTGPTLKDLDACFLTYHSLFTPKGDVPGVKAPVMIYPDEIDGVPRITLPVFGLSSYKFRGPLWTSNSGSDRQLVNSLSQAADNWVRLLQVNHNDYNFFWRNRWC